MLPFARRQRSLAAPKPRPRAPRLAGSAVALRPSHRSGEIRIAKDLGECDRIGPLVDDDLRGADGDPAAAQCGVPPMDRSAGVDRVTVTAIDLAPGTPMPKRVTLALAGPTAFMASFVLMQLAFGAAVDSGNRAGDLFREILGFGLFLIFLGSIVVIVVVLIGVIRQMSRRSTSPGESLHARFTAGRPLWCSFRRELQGMRERLSPARSERPGRPCLPM